jgi:hypothetical protein
VKYKFELQFDNATGPMIGDQITIEKLEPQTLDTWEFVSLVWDGRAGSGSVEIRTDLATLPLNINESCAEGTRGDDSARPFGIGNGEYPFPGRAVEGEIDEVRVARTARSPVTSSPSGRWKRSRKARTLARMYSLLACDIDDTILDENGSLPSENRDVLRRLHDRGIAVVLSSGRATVSVRPVAERILPLSDDIYLLSFNGARVVTAVSDHPIYEQFLPMDVVRDVSAYCAEHALLVQGYDDRAFLAQVRSEDNRVRAKRYSVDASIECIEVGDLAAAIDGGSPKLLCINDHDELLEHKKRLDVLGEGRFVTTFSKPHYLEILHPLVNKGIGLTRLAEHLRVPTVEVVAVGDSLNDIEMLRAAGLGVAVANARDELKEIADVVLQRRASDGAIAEVEERFFP